MTIDQNDRWQKTETDIVADCNGFKKEIQLVKPINSANDMLFFYQDSDKILKAALIDLNNGLRKENFDIFSFHHIKTFDETNSFYVHNFNDEYFMIFWENEEQNLMSQIFQLKNNQFEKYDEPLMLLEKKTTGFSFGGIISVANKFSVRRNQFYFFNTSGLLISMKLDSLVERKVQPDTVYKPNQFQTYVRPDIFSEIHYDYYGKIYFVYENNIYYIKLTSDNKVESLNKIEIIYHNGQRYTSGANGNFYVRNNGTIYFVGKDRRLYQAYVHRINQDGTETYRTIESSPFSNPNDASLNFNPLFVDSYPFKVLFANDTKSLSELYYYNFFNYCSPQFMKKDFSEEEAFSNYSFEKKTIKIEKKTEYKTIEIYPNPTNSKVFIKHHFKNSAELEYDVYDVFGNQVLSGIYENGCGIDASTLKSGVYVLKVKSDEVEFKEKKIVVAK
ncbi:MAG: T9SS type A sorting domain-containing protein [Cytophagales bacterium]